MPEYLIKGESLTALADEIRVLSGTEDAMGLDDMVSNLRDVNISVDNAIAALANKCVNTTVEGLAELAEKIDTIAIEEYIVEVTVDSGATVIVTNGTDTYTGVSNGTCAIKVYDKGEWSCYAILNGVQSATNIIDVTNTFTTALTFFTANVTVNTSQGALVTAKKGNTTISNTASSSGVADFIIRESGDWIFTVTKDGKTVSETVSITAEQDYTIDLSIDLLILNNNSWAKIREISDAGTGRNYWSIGDCKAVHLSGVVGTMSLNTTLYVYILGFNHNASKEGYGIQFGGFKTASDSSGVNVCLTDGYYLNYITNGSKVYTINHWGSFNYGGWGGSDMRYDILGGTDSAPSGYGGAKNTFVIGYDATSNCVTSPVANTLMSCLPSDLRAVMKPITKYTNNVGGSGDTQEKVTAIIDYLTLPSEFEVFGVHNVANSYESNHQMQYEYFSAGNDKIKYKHSDLGTAAYWWMRSPFSNDAASFCAVAGGGYSTGGGANVVCGIAPIFMV